MKICQTWAEESHILTNSRQTPLSRNYSGLEFHNTVKSVEVVSAYTKRSIKYTNMPYIRSKVEELFMVFFYVFDLKTDAVNLIVNLNVLVERHTVE